MFIFNRRGAAAACLSLCAGVASAATVDVTISNNSGPNGLYFTPFLNVFHDGSYTPFTPGQTASAGVEELAEVGSTATAAAEAMAQVPGATVLTLVEPTGFGSQPGQPPVFDPGSSASFRIDLDPTENRYLTLLSMAIPSNDTFVSVTIDLFTGGAVNIGTTVLDLNNVYDAGTEINQTFGQAFNPVDGNGPGFLGDDENGVIHSPSLAEFATLFNQPIPPGGVSSLANTDLSNLVSVEIAPVPLPAAAPLLLVGMGGLALMARRRKQRS